MPFSHGDDATVLAALHKVAPQELPYPAQRDMAEVALHAADALLRKVAHHTAVAVELLFAIVEQPVHDERRDAALLGGKRLAAAS